MNDYLKEVTGGDITAKDSARGPERFWRRWPSTSWRVSIARPRRNVTFAPQSKRYLRVLGNTPTICRKCYVHPEVLNSYMDGNLVL